MTTRSISATVAVIGGGVVGAAITFTLAHRGVDVVLLESDSDLAYSASGTNSGVLHTGFDSTPGQLETELIIRSAAIRPAVLDALDVPVIHAGAELVPHQPEDHDTIRELAANAATNGVEVSIRKSDGALLVPGESVTDPVAFTLALAGSAVAAGAQVELNARVVGASTSEDGVTLQLEDGGEVTAKLAINSAGLHADDIARLFGDDSFEIYPRKGEFFVFELPEGKTLDHIVLPVPTKRTKGVLVFPTLDGHVVAGPTAVDLEDKNDWSVRAEAHTEVLEKAAANYPALEGLTPIATYAGLRPAGRDTNYVIGVSDASDKLINVAAIRSTGLSASLGIGAYVADLLPGLGIETTEQQAPTPITDRAVPQGEWWRRTANRHAAAQPTVEQVQR
ncbi:glycerol-3-phosphate dehydrogenase [Curtobacterium pusillum]|uniref:Glycerol-3-phosphate dehydrogenase n=1 Tax=Curtobacterium pusillum TaxID=69373 RepID=A0AAW3T8P0_9MICO|nr:FAD-dependent oxidoreductase [Curtobacterium pusillum]MBA8990762.1 glycerol-3-phosphate dehydrogenase [Curtobacterium pusillum]